MKTWGIVLIVFGSLSLLGALLAAANGAAGSAGGIAFIVLGAYLIHRAKQKEDEKSHHDNWSNEQQ